MRRQPQRSDRNDPGFNEAGILHPGMPETQRALRGLGVCFNEAGILHPGMLVFRGHLH